MVHTGENQKIQPLEVKGWNPSSPRRNLGDLTTLETSIKNVGLIAPIVLDRNKILIDGERRLTIFHQLSEPIPFVYRDELSEDDLYELELEANRHRKDFDWKEEVEKSYNLYKRKKKESALEGETFGHRQAGSLLGVSYGYAQALPKIADALAKGDKEMHSCDSFSDAFKLIIKRNEEKGQADLRGISFNTKQLPQAISIIEESEVLSSEDQPLTLTEEIPLSRILFNEDCREFMSRVSPESFDHILSDPPYGIDPDLMDLHSKVENIRESHQVAENLDLLQVSIPLLYRVLRNGGFCILWYDLDHHEKLQNLAKSVGFKVQRWPIIWHKTHSCLNQAAGFNFTKNIEYAMVLRKGNATLTNPQQTSVWSGEGASEAKMSNNPFAKPHGLWKFLIEAVSIRGQTIFDPFAGGGSCPRALVNCGRNPIACEKDPKHFNDMVSNMKSIYNIFTNNKARFI